MKKTMTIVGLTGAQAAESRGVNSSLYKNLIGSIYKGSPKGDGNTSGRDLLSCFRIEGYTNTVTRALKQFFDGQIIDSKARGLARQSVLASEIPIMLMGDTPDTCLDSSMQFFSGNTCQVICNGETISKKLIDKQFKSVSEPCICKAQGHFGQVKVRGQLVNKPCTPTGKLRVIIYGFPVAGHFIFRTGGTYDLMSLNDTLYSTRLHLNDLGRADVGLDKIPCILYRSGVKRKAKGNRRDIGEVSIRLDERFSQQIQNTLYRDAIASAGNARLLSPSPVEADIIDVEEEPDPRAKETGVVNDLGLPSDISYKSSVAWKDLTIAFDGAMTYERVTTVFDEANNSKDFPEHAQGSIKALRDLAMQRVDQLTQDRAGAPVPHTNQTTLLEVAGILFSDNQHEERVAIIRTAIATTLGDMRAAAMDADQMFTVFCRLAWFYSEGEGLATYLDLNEDDLSCFLEQYKEETLDQAARKFVAYAADQIPSGEADIYYGEEE